MGRERERDRHGMGTGRDGNRTGWEQDGMGTGRDGNRTGWELNGNGRERDGMGDGRKDTAMEP